MATSRKSDEASSSSSEPSSSNHLIYDVFLSFRGEDTRNKFTGHLYQALKDAGINVFIDENELKRGEIINEELVRAIQGSKISVIVFSTRYGDSSWCLEELLKIMECRTTLRQRVFPVFYDVDPSDVRNQSGIFGEAFDQKHGKKDQSKVRRWRAALTDAANLSGWDLKTKADGHEANFIRMIIQEIYEFLNNPDLKVEDIEVGIDSRMQDTVYLLDVGKAHVGIYDVRIYDVRGIGKTTVAAIFNKICQSFKASSFVADVRATMQTKEDMVITGTANIRSGDNEITIKARVCRLWRGKRLNPVERNDGLHCVLVDQHNNAIHAVSKETDYEEISERIAPGFIYQISNFHATDNQDKFIIVAHEAQLMFTNRTQFTVLPEALPYIPHHWFDLIDFADIRDRQNNDTVLSDVIGRIKTVYPVDDISLDSRIARKRTLELQNLRRETIRITLWGSLGVNLDIAAMKRMQPPVVAIFTSTKVGSYDGNTILNSGMSTCMYLSPVIPEFDEYKAMYNKPFYTPFFFGDTDGGRGRSSNSSANDNSDMEIISVKDLNKKKTNPQRQVHGMEATFFVRARITKMMNEEGWFYMSCPKCQKQLRPMKNDFVLGCQIHGEQEGIPMYELEVRIEDDSDSVTVMTFGRAGDSLFGITCEQVVKLEAQIGKRRIPPVLMELMEQTRIWKLGYGIRNNDFVVKAVFFDGETGGEKIAHGAPVVTKTPEKPPAKRTVEFSDDCTLSQVVQHRSAVKKTRK